MHEDYMKGRKEEEKKLTCGIKCSKIEALQLNLNSYCGEFRIF